jgi:hypothetical protein
MGQSLAVGTTTGKSHNHLCRLHCRPIHCHCRIASSSSSPSVYRHHRCLYVELFEQARWYVHLLLPHCGLWPKTFIKSLSRNPTRPKPNQSRSKFAIIHMICHVAPQISRDLNLQSTSNLQIRGDSNSHNSWNK